MPYSNRRRMFTVQEKLSIITRLRNGENNIDLSKEFNVSHSTISSIWKNQDKIQESKYFEAKKIRKPTHPDVEAALLMWVKVGRAHNVNINGRVLRDKANHFAKLLGKKNVYITESWIHRFRQRNDILSSKKCEKKASPENDDWLKAVFPVIIEGYTESEIWNSGETGLFYKLTPERIAEVKGENCIDGKLADERLTLLLACSMAGEKRKLLVIGKTSNPKCFKNIKSLPVDYESNEKSFITSQIFEKALRKWDIELSVENKKIILFVDDSVHHKVEKLTNIKLAFLPSNFATTQPLKTIVTALKTHYRGNLIQNMLNDKCEKPAPFFIHLLDAIEMLTTAWTLVTSETIRKCFSDAGFNRSSNFIKTEPDDLFYNTPDTQFSSTSFEEVYKTNWKTYFNIDSGTATTNPVEVLSSRSVEENHREKVPTVNAALKAVTVLKRFCLFGKGKNMINIEELVKMEQILHTMSIKVNKT